MNGPTSQSCESASDIPVGYYVYSHGTSRWLLVTGKAVTDGRTRLAVEGQATTIDYESDESVHVCAPLY